MFDLSARRLASPRDRPAARPVSTHTETMNSAPRRSIRSRGSLLSIGSVDSVLSIGSVGSVLSIGAVGSFGSVGSIGSAMSAASIGSFQSAGAVLSGQSNRSLLSWQSNRAVLANRVSGDLSPASLLPIAIAGLTLGVLWAALVRKR